MSQKSVAPPRIILVALDGSELSYKALDSAFMIASLTNAKIVAVHVILLPAYVSDDVLIRLKHDLLTASKGILNKAESRAKDANVVFDSRVVETRSSVVKAIVDAAGEVRADLIALGTRGTSQGMPRLMLGSVAVGVVSFAPCPVLVVR